MKKILKKVITALWCIICMCTTAAAQDTHFSQYNASPLVLNPALSGLSNGDYRVYTNFRSQWMTVSKASAYRSFAAGADMAVGKVTRYNSFAGLGISFLNTQAGVIRLSTNRLDLTFAYHFMLNHRGTQQISLGVQGGFNMRTIDPSRAVYDSQYDPVSGTLNPYAAGESYGKTKVLFADAGAGVLYSGIFKRGNHLYLGFAMAHLNRPNVSFQPSGLEAPDKAQQRLAMKYTIHGGMLLPMGKRLALMPNFMVLVQGTANEFNLGLHLRSALGNMKTSATYLYFGAQYRGLVDAVIVSGRMDIKGFTMGLSYDINISKLLPATKTVGAPEISLMYQGSFKKKPRPWHCPAMI